MTMIRRAGGMGPCSGLELTRDAYGGSNPRRLMDGSSPTFSPTGPPEAAPLPSSRAGGSSTSGGMSPAPSGLPQVY